MKKKLFQVLLMLALIVGFTACEKEVANPPINAVETPDTQDDEPTTGENSEAFFRMQQDCEALLEELLDTYTDEELAELGIAPETFCDDVEWDEEDEWDDVDWEMDCDSLVVLFADELEMLGFEPETFCEDIFDDVVVIHIDLDDFTIENCDSLIAIYAEELEELGFEVENFCEEWTGWSDDDDDGDDWDDWDDIDWEGSCDSLVIVYAEQLEEWGIDPEAFCEEWGEWEDDDDDDDDDDENEEEEGEDDDDGDAEFNCEILIAIFGSQLEEWGFDLDTFCDEVGDLDDENAICIVFTECGVFPYTETVEATAENGQISISNEEGEVLDTVECESEGVEVECYGG